MFNCMDLETTYYSNDHFNPGLKGANRFMSFTDYTKTDPRHIDYINQIPIICLCLTKLLLPIYELLLLNQYLYIILQRCLFLSIQRGSRYP
jgi:hypothetical protein